MAVQVISPPSGLLPYKPKDRRMENLLKDVAGGVQNFQSTRKNRLTEAVNAALKRGQLTGSIGQTSPTESKGFSEMLGIDDPSTVQPTELGQKFAQAKAIYPEIAGADSLMQSLMGIKQNDPMTKATKFLKTYKDTVKLIPGARETGVTPPNEVIAYVEGITGQKWPTDPNTGEKVKYFPQTADDDDLTKIKGKIKAAARMAGGVDSKLSDVTKQEIENIFILPEFGVDWETQYPELAQFVDQIVMAANPEPEPVLPAKDSGPAWYEKLYDKTKGFFQEPQQQPAGLTPEQALEELKRRGKL